MNIDQNRIIAKLLARIQQLEMDNAVLASAVEQLQEEMTRAAGDPNGPSDPASDPAIPVGIPEDLPPEIQGP